MVCIIGRFSLLMVRIVLVIGWFGWLMTSMCLIPGTIQLHVDVWDLFMCIYFRPLEGLVGKMFSLHQSGAELDIVPLNAFVGSSRLLKVESWLLYLVVFRCRLGDFSVSYKSSVSFCRFFDHFIQLIFSS
ncbi:hypothetical protein Droror1_Dr00011539 [Drosera rotundifolia]